VKVTLRVELGRGQEKKPVRVYTLLKNLPVGRHTQPTKINGGFLTRKERPATGRTGLPPPILRLGVKELNIDIETYSSVDLKKSGVYAYVASPDFEVMLFGYAIDGGKTHCVDLMNGEEIPEEVIEAITDPDVIKRAFNANFERTCLAKHFGKPMPPNQWRCTSVLALTLGLPGHLAEVGRVVGLPQDKQKMGIGGGLIRFFCIPCKPTKKNGQRTRNFPHHDKDRWALFIEYCKGDVVSEMAVVEKLIRWDLPDREWDMWFLDQDVNDRGIVIDRELVDAAIEIDNETKASLTAQFVALTGITKATQVAKLKAWLDEEFDIQADSLNKQAVKDILATTDEFAVEEALRLRQELSKSSVAKYKAMGRAVTPDDRVRGLYQFYGANRTGRWAGRLVQMQNLTKTDLSLRDQMLARQLVKDRDIDTLEILFGPVQPLLSGLIRSAFLPKPGNTFVVIDFSAIEARVLAWGALCQWRLDVFKTHGKIYEASAEQMFKLPAGSVGKSSPYRQKGKIAELALGYLGGVGALITMGALRMGLSEPELQPIVTAWREANPEIVDFAREMEANAKKTLRKKMAHGVPGRYQFRYESGMLFMDLPSGRSLCYVKPRIVEEDGYRNITYDGMDQETKRWGRTKTYAGKLVENWTQAVARDCLAEVLPQFDVLPNVEIVGHVHDEAILETLETLGAEILHQGEKIMAQDIVWAPGLPLRGDGFVTPFYRKD
jgi:DNA polymerase bacteriophage-type